MTRARRGAACLALVLILLAPGRARGEPLTWDYPEFSTAEWVTAGLFLGVTIAMEIMPPQKPKLEGGIWVDEDVRDAMAVLDPEDQRIPRTVSDVMLTVLAAYPYLVDGVLVAGWHRRSPAVAKQIILINALTQAVTVGLTSIAKVVVGRERPYGRTCGAERPESLFDCEDDRRDRSFFSGHSSLSFASAGLICMHHGYLDLFSNAGADMGACAAALGVAAATSTLRIVADQHYFTDVLVGVGVGTLTGFGLPWLLHYRYGKNGPGRKGEEGGGGGGPVQAQLVPTANGVALTGTFDETGGSAGQGTPPAPDALGLREKDAEQATWAGGRVRPFLATRVDVGFLYLKPRVSLGYGRPHHAWVGVDFNPIVSLRHAGLWGGLRGTLGWIDLRVGGRYQYAWHRSLLQPRATYTQDDINDLSGPASSLLSLEAELSLDLPVAGGSIQSELALTHVLGVEEGYFAYEETLKVVVDPPWAWRARFGYTHHLDRRGAVRLGMVVELAAVPRRNAYTFRAGLVGSVRVMRNLEARLTVLPTWFSHDGLGDDGTDLILVGLRYRWATGTPIF